MITNQKFNENNYLQWKRVIETYVAGRENTSHLLEDPPTPVINAWTLDNILLHQMLTTMKPKIHDLILLSWPKGVTVFSTWTLRKKQQHQQGIWHYPTAVSEEVEWSFHEWSLRRVQSPSRRGSTYIFNSVRCEADTEPVELDNSTDLLGYSRPCLFVS